MGKLVKNGRDYTGGGGITSYNGLNDKPSINSVELSGNKTADALGLVTKAVNDLVNYYLKSETYSKTEVDAIVTAIKNSRFEVVSSLPTTDIKTNVIYLVPSADPQTSNAKDEYINLDGTTAGWELIGSTSVDLSGYVTTTALNTALANYTTTTDLTTLLAGKQDKIQLGTMPTASADYLGKIVQFTGATNSTYTHGYFYECKESGGVYSWEATPVQAGGSGGTSDYTDLSNKPSIENVTLSGNKSASDLGLTKVRELTQVQYDALSTEEKNNGTTYFITDGSGGGGGTGGGHTIEDSTGTDLTQRDTLQFGEGFNVSDDSTNEKTVITPDIMQSGDMDDVLTPLPSVQPNMPVLYDDSGTERWIGYAIVNGVKKKLYEKTYTGLSSGNAPDADYTFLTLSNMNIISYDGWIFDKKFPLVFYLDSTHFATVAPNNNGFYIRQHNYSNVSIILTIRYTKSNE